MLPDERDRALDAATDRFWDELAQGRAGQIAGVDPADVAAIRHLHAFDDRRGPAHAFARRLRAELLHVHALPVSSEPSPRTLPNGHSADPPRGTRPRTPPADGPDRRRFAALAAAILLLVVGGLGSYLVGRDRDDRRTSIPAVVAPATAPSSDEMPSPTATTDPTLVVIDLPIGSLPQGPTGATFGRQSMPPRSQATVQDAQDFLLRYVIAGSVTVRPADPMRLLREGSAGVWEEVAAGVEIALGPGDTFLLQHATTIDFVNTGATPVEFITWEMAASGSAMSTAPQGWAIHNRAGTGGAVLDLPEVPAQARLRRIELPPGAELPPQPGALLSLTISSIEDAVLSASSPTLARLADGTRRNAGRQAIVIYELVLEPQDAGTGALTTGYSPPLNEHPTLERSDAAPIRA